MSNPAVSKYPLLEEILTMKGLSLQPTYSNRDVANIFNVSIRAIQARIKAGGLSARVLPGQPGFCRSTSKRSSSTAPEPPARRPPIQRANRH
jgi:hypothetical protein